MSEFESSTSSSSVPFTTSNSTSDYEVSPVDVIEGLNLPYAVCEVLVAICAVVGNALVILVFHRERRLRRRTNYYIISLATADFLVGLLGIPFAVLASVGLPRNLYACLFTVSLLVVLCTISIFCLVAVSVDRYWAILHPMAYSRNVRTKTAIGIIGICWFSGTFIGFLPLFGWHANREQTQHQRCLFTEVMDYDYLVFLYFATIIFPAMLLAAFYAHIYQVVLKQLRQIVTMNPKSGDSSSGAVSSTRAASGGTMLRVFGAAQKREVKATKNLSIIVFFFIICWIPLYTINCVLAFCPNCQVSLTLTNCCIILSHLNSAGNPLLYAYHLRDFRAALKNLLCGFFGVKDEVTEYHGPRASIGSHVHHHVQSRNNSVQSLRDAHQVKMAGYSDFNVANACLPPLPPLPLELQPRMWTLAEVPSVCEDDVSNSAQARESLSYTPACVRAQPGRNGAQRADGKVNSGYIDDAMEFEEGDDDVFDDAAVVESTLRPINVSALNELPFRNCSFTSVWGSRASSMRRGGMPSASASPQRSDIRGSEESLSSVDSSDDLAKRNNSLLIVEAQINNRRVEIDDKTELSSSLRRSPVIVASRDLKVSTNIQSVPSGGGADAKETASRRSPLKQIKSPMKYVGDFLFKSGKSVKQEPGNGDAAPTNVPTNAPAAPGTGVDERSSINQRTNGSVRFKPDLLEQSPDGHSAVT